MGRLLPLLFLLTPLLASAAGVYTWVDEKGNRVFSDDPRPGAEEVELREATTYTPPPLHAPTPASAKAPTEAAPAYEMVAVTSPQAEETVRDSAGNVTVSVASEPELARSHLFRLVLDGAPAGEPFRGGSATIANVDRGEHEVAVQVLDGDGTVVAESEPVTFHLRRFSRLFEPPAGDAGSTSGGVQQAPRAPMAPRAPRANTTP